MKKSRPELFVDDRSLYDLYFNSDVWLEVFNLSFGDFWPVLGCFWGIFRMFCLFLGCKSLRMMVTLQLYWLFKENR